MPPVRLLVLVLVPVPVPVPALLQQCWSVTGLKSLVMSPNGAMTMLRSMTRAVVRRRRNVLARKLSDFRLLALELFV